jgi:ACT domain-containing protein
MKMHKKNEFLEELRKIPIIEKACEKVGISRMTYYRWIDSSPSFKKEVGLAMSMGVDRIGDLSNAKLLQLMNEGNLNSIVYWNEKRSKGLQNTADRLLGINSEISMNEAVVIAEKNILEKMLSGDINESKYLLENNDERYLSPMKTKLRNEYERKAQETSQEKLERDVQDAVKMFSRFAGMKDVLNPITESETLDQTPPPQTEASSAEQQDLPSPAE